MRHPGNSITITATENGYIVFLPVRYKAPTRKHRLRVDHGSDPVLDEIKEKQEEKEELKPEPFKFIIQEGVHVCKTYEDVLSLLGSLANAEKGYSGNPGGGGLVVDEYFD